MSIKVPINCPYHFTNEEIEIPDSYLGTAYEEGHSVHFEGDIPCNPINSGDRPCILSVKIHFQKTKVDHVERLELKQNPR